MKCFEDENGIVPPEATFQTFHDTNLPTCGLNDEYTDTRNETSGTESGMGTEKPDTGTDTHDELRVYKISIQ